MILVTEPIFGSLRNMMTKFESVPGVSPESKAVSNNWLSTAIISAVKGSCISNITSH